MTVRAFRHLETTRVFVDTCRRCGRTVLFGLAEGVPARVDPLPFDPPAELLAVIAGRQTYTLRLSGLIHRDAGRRSDPTLVGPILAEHRCLRRIT
jgi:hypothetical protein